MVLSRVNIPATQLGSWTRSFLDLTKPRLVSMILITTTAGFLLAPTSVDWWQLIKTVIGTALSAGGTLALNQYLERDTDALMQRTACRPIPNGRLSPGEALIFGLSISTGGVIYLGLAVNLLSAVTITIIHLTYLLVYTPLKQKSPASTFLGAIPGALPPVVGWTAATGRLEPGAIVLFAILFWWQLPHSLSIAWLYREEYARAGFRLLPIVQPKGESTFFHIWFQTLILLFVGLLPALPMVQIAGYRYLVVATIVGSIFFGFSLALARSPSQLAAKRIMFTSLIYLPVIMIAMIVDKFFL